MTPLAQMPETGTGRVELLSKAPFKSLSREIRTRPMSPLPKDR
jgi:hypothetical protein